MKSLNKFLISTSLLILLILISLNASYINSVQYVSREDTGNIDYETSFSEGMALVSNARGEYGLYWQWWPPGFVRKPQLMAESSNVFMHWCDEIGQIYEDNNVNKDVYKLYSYNWIVDHPNSPRTELKNSILDFIEEHSYHWKFIILMGHASDVAWEAYYWNHNHETYYTTNNMLPDNNIWTPDNNDVYVDIYTPEIRNIMEEREWLYLPHIAFVVGCDSAGKYYDYGGWAWAFMLSEEDYYNGLWDCRGFVGFDGDVYYNWLSGDYPAIDLVKRMIGHMSYDLDDAVTAFQEATDETGFDYIIITSPEEEGYEISGSGDQEAIAVYIGDDWVWQDPSSQEIALNTALNFLRSYVPRVYELLVDKSVQPTIKAKSPSLWLSRLANAEIYDIKWTIPVSDLFNESYYDIVFIIYVSVLVKNGVGTLYSVKIGGSVKESPEIEIDRDRLNELENMISGYLSPIKENLSIYLNYILDNAPEGLTYELSLSRYNNSHYKIIVEDLDAPIYVQDGQLRSLTIKAVYQKTLVIVSNPMVLINDYLEKIRSLNKPVISLDQALARVKQEFKDFDKAEVNRNLSLIVLIDSDTRDIGLYYYGSYKIDERIYQVLVDAYTGSVDIQQYWLAGNIKGGEPDNGFNKYLSVIPIIIAIAVIVLLIIFVGKRRFR